MNILVSACLLGTACRYSGDGSLDDNIKSLMKYHHLIPVCPEQLGGMTTPRTPAERRGELVINKLEEDVTGYFKQGACETLKLQKLYHSPMAILKARSPSCGSGKIYDGFFTNILVDGNGVTAELLKSRGSLVLSESQCPKFLQMEETGIIIETDRLVLRKLSCEDYDNLCTILQDESVMYAYEHAFSDEEVRTWLNRQLERYASYGFGLWGVIDKSTGDFIGQCGITMQELEDKPVPEIGYLFAKNYWHQGFATEAARACKTMAFDFFGMEEIYSIIRENNTASRNVAKRNGMTEWGFQMKHYYSIDMPHVVYKISK